MKDNLHIYEIFLPSQSYNLSLKWARLKKKGHDIHGHKSSRAQGYLSSEVLHLNLATFRGERQEMRLSGRGRQYQKLKCDCGNGNIKVSEVDRWEKGK